MPDTSFLTVDELLARWKGVVTKGTLANWRSKKVGPPYIKLRTKVVYPLCQLNDWEQANAFAGVDCGEHCKEDSKCNKAK